MFSNLPIEPNFQALFLVSTLKVVQDMRYLHAQHPWNWGSDNPAIAHAVNGKILPEGSASLPHT